MHVTQDRIQVLPQRQLIRYTFAQLATPTAHSFRGACWHNPSNNKVHGYHNSAYEQLVTQDVTIDGAYDYKLLADAAPLKRILKEDLRAQQEQEPALVTGTIHQGLINFGAIGAFEHIGSKSPAANTLQGVLQPAVIPPRGLQMV